MRVKEITALIDSLSAKDFYDCPSGAFCRFIKLNDKWAVKLYSSECKRDSAYAAQKRFAENGLAPLVGGRMKVVSRYAPKIWGYISEIVVAVPHDCSRWDVIPFHVETGINQCVEKIQNVLGYYWKDTTYFNFGLKNDSLVPIDFSEF